MLKAYKYRIYPNKQQTELLLKHFGCVRFIYNWALNKKIEYYETTKKSLSYFELSNEVTQMKKKEEFIWLNDIYSQSLQMSLRNLDIAYKNFFRKKIGFPKFKSKKKNKDSFQLPQNVKINFETKKLKLPKIGLVNVKIDRNFIGIIKTCTVSKTPSNKFFISILVENNIILNENKPKIKEQTTLGIDVGISSFLTLSNGIKIENPRYLKKSLDKLKFQQKKFSKKQKGSNNRNKHRIKLAKIYETITNKRNDFLHKLSYKLTHDNQVNTLAIETLDIANMIKNKNLSQLISDVSWSKFISMLEYKCNWYNKNLIYIGQFEPSSKICSQCGTINRELKLSNRTWICKNCNKEHDRDINAAINIKKFALNKQNLIGVVNPKSTLVESNSLESR
jgi:putative transposase